VDIHRNTKKQKRKEMTYDYKKLQKLYTKHKGALTRAKKKGPKAVIEAVEKFYAAFEAEDAPLPDNWRLWEVAKEDAGFELRRQSLSPTCVKGGKNRDS